MVKKTKLAAQLKAQLGGIEPRRIVRVGRNQPCPCGSGKKYKECHQREGEEFLQKLTRRREKERLIRQQKEQGVPWYRRWLSRISAS